MERRGRDSAQERLLSFLLRRAGMSSEEEAMRAMEQEARTSETASSGAAVAQAEEAAKAATAEAPTAQGKKRNGGEDQDIRETGGLETLMQLSRSQQVQNGQAEAVAGSDASAGIPNNDDRVKRRKKA